MVYASLSFFFTSSFIINFIKPTKKHKIFKFEIKQDKTQIILKLYKEFILA